MKRTVLTLVTAGECEPNVPIVRLCDCSKKIQFLGPLLFNLWFNWGLGLGMSSCVEHKDASFPCARDNMTCAMNHAEVCATRHAERILPLSRRRRNRATRSTLTCEGSAGDDASRRDLSRRSNTPKCEMCTARALRERTIEPRAKVDTAALTESEVWGDYGNDIMFELWNSYHGEHFWLERHTMVTS